MTDFIKGLDVSVVQGSNINWQAIVDANYKFCIVRCGVGNDKPDVNYVKNIANAKSVGLKVAAYHFVYPLPPLDSQPLRDPLKQAQLHFNAAQGELACCDLEWPATQDWSKWGCSSQQINDWGLSYLQEYSRLDGRKMIVYSYPFFAQAVKFSPEYAQYPLWIASYQKSPTIPSPWTDFALWQNSGGTDRLPGTGVPVDGDLAKDLSLWGTTDITVNSNDPVAQNSKNQPAQSSSSKPGILNNITNWWKKF